MLLTKRSTDSKQPAYASSGDFCRIFREEMDSLFRLSFWLTADTAKAEECFVGGLEDCVAGNSVFREWARSWARRAIIQNAIRVMSPRPEARRQTTVVPGAELRLAPAGVLELAAFERFAFVMSVLEKYSDRDSALLLGCTRQDVADARNRALLRLATLSTIPAPSEGPAVAALVAS